MFRSVSLLFFAPTLLLSATFDMAGAPPATDPGAAAQVSADQLSPASAATGVEQVAPPAPGAAAAATSQAHAAARRALSPTEQASPRGGMSLSSEQIARERRSASAPAEVSDRREGRSVAVVTVHGHDRCDPVKGEATQEECAGILDYRAEQFARPAAPEPSPEQTLIDSPPATSLAADATAARRLGAAEGADPNVAAEAAAVEGSPAGAQAAALAATDRAAPAVPLGALAPGAPAASAAAAPK